MRRTLGLRLVTGLLVGLLALIGCDGDDAAEPASSAPASTGTPPTATAPPDDAPPALPALAEQKSAAGAKAFVRYYVDVINDGYARGDTSALRAHSAASCAPCLAVASLIDRRSTSGGSQSGGEWMVESMHEGASESSRHRTYLTKIRSARGSSQSTATASPKPIKAREAYFVFTARWIKARWLLAQIESP